MAVVRITQRMESNAARFCACAIALPVLAPPDAEYAILQQATSAPKRANPLNIISFYRQYARRCEAAARNAPNEQMRAEHSKMVHVWREFAAEHERMVHEGSDFARLLNQSLKDWFLAHRIREAMAPLSAIVMGAEGKVIEADETYVGGKEKNKHRSKRIRGDNGGVAKETVFSLVERGDHVRSSPLADRHRMGPTR